MLRRLVLAILVSSGVFAAGPAMAQDWSRLDQRFGNGWGVCNMEGAGYACLAFRCDEEGRPQMVFLHSDFTEQSMPLSFALSVDGDKADLVSFRQKDQPGVHAVNQSLFSPDDVLLRLAKGTSLRLTNTREHRFSLRGAASAADWMLGNCVVDDGAITSLAEVEETARRYPVSGENGVSSTLRHLYGTDAQGHEIDTGHSNPALRGLDREGCIRACLVRGDCQLATLHEPSGLCSLKSGFGVLRADEAMFTTYVKQRPDRVLRPQLPGGSPVQMTGLRWQPGEQPETYIARMRTAAAPMGADCRQEQAVLAQVPQGIRVTPPKDTVEANGALDFAWTARRMSQRVPAWIVVSADKPVRFGGDGFFALTPGALGPFGLAEGQGMHRAYFPLHNGTEIEQGALSIEPLEAGALTLRATLVGYLRQCQQEVPLMRGEWTVRVDPAQPRLVLRDIAANDPFPRIIDIPEFNRRIRLNDTRFILEDARDGTEIVAREGKKVRLSPTRRFVTLYDDEFFEVIDAVDGKSLLHLKGQALAWWNADSFVLSDYAPWAEIDLASPLRGVELLSDLRTGPSCCLNNGDRLLSVDLENSVIQTHYGYRDDTSFRSLTTGAYIGEARETNYAPGKKSDLGGRVSPSVFAYFGFVAPVDTEERWNTPLGPIYTYGVEHRDANNTPEDRIVTQMAREKQISRFNPEFGQRVTVTSQKAAGTVLRAVAALPPDRDDGGFRAALRRWGVDLAEAVEPEERIADTTRAERQKLSKDLIERQRAHVRAAIEADLSRHGKYAVWSFLNPDEIATVTYCEYAPTMRDLNAGKETSLTGKTLESATDLDLAHRFDTGRFTIWVTRSYCSGGATGGTIAETASLNIFDSRHPTRNFANFRVDSDSMLGTSFRRVFFQVGFRSKLVAERYLLTFAAGEGAVSVFDLFSRKYLFKNDYVRRGDLLSDVYLDTAMRHLFQVNSDGSFTVYRLSDQAAILEGRYLDDELVVWTANFYFDATEEGAAFVELRFPGKPGQYSFQQFDKRLRLPGLMQTVLRGGGTPEKRPIGIPPELAGRIKPVAAQIVGTVRASGTSPLKQVRLYQDGILTDTFATGAGPEITINVPRRHGARWASLIAEDRDGLQSLPLSTDLGPVAGELSRTHFLGIGIDYYSDPGLGPLNYAKIDAVALSDTFAGLNGRNIDLRRNIVLTDRRASRDGIETELRQILDKAAPGDHLVLFFAGHGLKDQDGRFYLGTSKTDLADLDATALDWTRFAALLRDTGLRVTILLDACHSGAAGTAAFATNDTVAEGLVAQFPVGLTVLSAAKGRQYSGESSAIGGGYFTRALVDVLTVQRTTYDENNNGVLEAVELYRGVKSHVVGHRGGLQTPWLARNQLVGEYALF